MSNYAPPPPRGDGSCWKWGAIACLGMGCIGVGILGALLAYGGTRPGFKRILSTTQQAGREVERMQSVGRAIQKYALDKGKYPGKLSDLVPNYVSQDLLRSSTDLDGKRLVYTRPPADAPDSFHVLEVSVPNPVSPIQAPPIRYF